MYYVDSWEKTEIEIGISSQLSAVSVCFVALVLVYERKINVIFLCRSAVSLSLSLPPPLSLPKKKNSTLRPAPATTKEKKKRRRQPRKTKDKANRKRRKGQHNGKG
jgi:hypothetical protein